MTNMTKLVSILSSIGTTGAEIRPVKGLSKNSSFMTFYEPDKCTISYGTNSLFFFGYKIGVFRGDVLCIWAKGNHFKHTFSMIGPRGAELRPVKGLSKILSKNWPFIGAKGSTFSFSSFREPDKCAVFSGYNLSCSGYNLYRNNGPAKAAKYSANPLFLRFAKRAKMAELELIYTSVSQGLGVSQGIGCGLGCGISDLRDRSHQRFNCIYQAKSGTGFNRPYKTGLMGILTRSYKTGSFHDINYAKGNKALFFFGSIKFVVFFKTINDKQSRSNLPLKF